MKRINYKCVIHVVFVLILIQLGCDSEEPFRNCKFENNQWIYTSKQWGSKNPDVNERQIDTFSLSFLSDSILLRNGTMYVYYKPAKDHYKLRLNPKGKERHNFSDFMLTKKTASTYIYIDQLFGDTVNLELICE